MNAQDLQLKDVGDRYPGLGILVCNTSSLFLMLEIRTFPYQAGEQGEVIRITALSDSKAISPIGFEMMKNEIDDAAARFRRRVPLCIE